MISKEDWKEFTSWRIKKLKDWYSSDTCRELDKHDRELFKPVKSKFLFWETESSPDPSWIIRQTKKTNHLRTLLQPPVPKETLEECLSWLNRGKK